ncbi:MAG TPA: hypothetical protein VMW75_28910 [Thermoanaerobaculia bacterium]|nr:hypothetical protein [Thermoanaerobaculia bacterium]
MLFEKPSCPECGALARGTLEHLEGIALLTFDDSRKSAAYDGQTEILWDTQRTVTPQTDHLSLVCHCGATWLSTVRHHER